MPEISSKPAVIFLDSDKSALSVITHKIGDTVMIASSLAPLRSCLDFVGITIEPEPTSTLLGRALRQLEESNQRHDLILVNLTLGGPFESTVGKKLARDLKASLTDQPIGVYTPFALSAMEKVSLSLEGFAIFLEQIRDLYEGFERLTGDEWQKLLNGAISTRLKVDPQSEANSKGSIVLRFEFPNEAKNACSRYLIYFLEILKNSGIDASYVIQETNGEVIFSLHPASDVATVEDVSAALLAYLYLPSARLNVANDLDRHDRMVVRLIRKIRELQSELALADATIRVQKQALDAKDRFLESMVMIESLKEAKPPLKENLDAAQLLGGFVEIRSIEYKGFVFKLGKLINFLKDLAEGRDD